MPFQPQKEMDALLLNSLLSNTYSAGFHIRTVITIESDYHIFSWLIF
nr:MAG TPA: hypothetical protein [Caudoviricetes sp.]